NEYSDRDYTFSAAVAEFTVARLVEDHDVRLTITNAEKDEVILSIPLIDIVLMVKDFYNQDMSDQEYLDRQDEYSLVFFIDDEGRWVDSYIYINTWRVVLQSAGL
ncbi:MAG: FimB/Mfa2 family fimbrial subunit, partial [Bacteroidales bacterium]|nr:FimB/Mfa2 family fimbrial subunit [Bacteroidales bacterium]